MSFLLRLYMIFLKIPLYPFDDFEKDNDMDVIATELLGIDTKWPGKKTF